MAFDGIVTAALVSELRAVLKDGRISKISQPEKDEIFLVVRGFGANYKLRISVNASLPLVCLTERNFASPMQAPNFCMLLRKHISNGRITDITQMGLDRVIVFDIEHRDELGDLVNKKLVVELMGKHSNIIFIDDNNTVIDSIKRVPASVSSLREVLPGREYFTPNTRDQASTLELTPDMLKEKVLASPDPLSKAINRGLSGISPAMATELCVRAGLDADAAANLLSEADAEQLYTSIEQLAENIRFESFCPVVVYDGDTPADYSAVPMMMFEGRRTEEYETMSELLEAYYSEKALKVLMRQKSSDLRHIVQMRAERAYKKLDLQRKQMSDTEKKDKFKVWGELLNTYGYNLQGGEKSLTCLNYYTNEDEVIPLDPMLSASENSKKYFARYGKLKRTASALAPQIEATEAEIEHLESIKASLETAETDIDLNEIRREMADAGFIKSGSSKDKKKQIKNAPIHYIAEGDFHIYVGKNNFQNEEVTFKIATGNDWWFHAKKMPGSHVIVKTEGRELPDELYEICAALAAHYSSGKDQEKVEIDYVQRREVKKVAGARPGYVIYHTNYSMVAKPEVSEKLVLC